MKIEKILRYGILTGIFLIPFLVLFVDGTLFFPFITGKNFAFRIIVEVITTLFLILCLTDKAYRPKRSVLLLALAGFLLSLSISTVLSENPLKSFWSNFERMEGLISHIHFFLYFVVMGSILSKEVLWIRFFNTSLFASLLVSTYSLAQLAGKITINQGGTRIDATLGNATYLAVYLLFHIFLTLFLIFRTKIKWLWFTYGALMFLHLYLLYHTATRGAILGVIGGFFISAFLIALFEKDRKHIRKGAFTILAAVIILVSGFFALKDAQFVKDSPVLSRFSSINLEERTTKSRFLIWNMAWQGFKERPIFGWGQESFNYAFNKYYSPKMYDQELWFDRTHNVIFDWLIASGIVGLFFYLSIFGTALYLLWKKAGASLSFVDKSLFTGLLGAYFFHNLFVFDNFGSYFLFFSVLAFIHFLTVKDSKESDFNIAPQTAHIASATIIVISLSLMYVANVPALLSAKSLIKAISPNSSGDLTLNLKDFEKALSYHSFGDSEIREHLAQSANQVVRAPSVSNDIKMQFATLTMKELEKQLELTPNDTRYQMFAAVSSNAFGNYDQGVVYSNQAIESSPGKQAAYFELGNSYIGKGDYQKVFEIFKTAYELEPAYEDAKIIYTLGAIYAGKKDVEKELISSLEEKTLYFDDRILRAYASQNNYDKVFEILGKRIEKNPSDTASRLSRAGLYLERGNRAQTIKEIEEIIKIDPTFKEQGEYYIAEIKAGRNP